MRWFVHHWDLCLAVVLGVGMVVAALVALRPRVVERHIRMSALQPDGTLKCSRCGGTQFVARHSRRQKIAWESERPPLQPNEDHCVACGSTYPRVFVPSAVPSSKPGSIT